MNMNIGTFDVVTTQDCGHDIEFYADRIVARMISVSDTAPEPIKAQALMYQESLKAIVLDGLKRAIRSDRSTVVNELTMRGMGEAAAYIALMTTEK